MRSASSPERIARHLFSRNHQSGGRSDTSASGSPPWSWNQCASMCTKATIASSSYIVAGPSQIRISSVPSRGLGRRYHQISFMLSIDPVYTMVADRALKSAHALIGQDWTDVGGDSL